MYVSQCLLLVRSMMQSFCPIFYPFNYILLMICINHFTADPKSCQTTKLKTKFDKQPLSMIKHRAQIRAANTKENADEQETKQFLGLMPYQCDTVFGYITLIDPEMKVKEAIYGEPPYNSIAKLDEGELKILDLMIEGKFYSHTGMKNFIICKNVRK